ncbi:FAD-dependent oxidoreductase [Novosphingobium sp. BL-8A]|uniref:FAD-dependent oxidoreductase n=1 Tax=Novosphingobium sp. BL-8A TaxID=3127639 RepID=UPI003758401E
MHDFEGPSPMNVDTALVSANHGVVVIGAGIAGLAAADRLSACGHRVRVIEASPLAGGTHRSRVIGPYSFDVGSIFYEDNALLFELEPGLREICPKVRRLQRRIGPDGQLHHYPLEPRDFLKQQPWKLPWSLLDLAFSRLAVRRDGSLDAICRQRLGSSFFRATGLESYITRFHHVPAREVDETFFFQRMAFIEHATRLGAMARAAATTVFSRQAASARPRRPLFVRPPQGSEAIFTPIIRRLEARGVSFSFNEPLLELGRIGDHHRIRTSNRTLLAEAVVSTIPLDTTHRALTGQPSRLVSLGMTTLFVSASWLSPDAGNVLFNFDRQGRWKRATIYSRIYPGTGSGREYFAVETTIPPGGRHDPEGCFADFRAHVTRLGIATGLILEGAERIDNCYPLYRPGTAAAQAQALDQVTAAGIIAAGRQGRFEYLPTSTGVIARVREELASLGTPMPDGEPGLGPDGAPQGDWPGNCSRVVAA